MAVGILSTLSSFSRRALSSASHSLMRRSLVRNSTRPLHAQDVALRFLVASPSRVESPEMRAQLHSEMSRFGDLILLNMTEHFLRCPLKYLLWLRLAPALFPKALWIVSGDDDIYVQLEHLSAELRLVGSQTGAESQPVLWGLITWKTFMNSATFDTSTGFTGWLFTDAAATGRRRAVHRCLANSPNATPGAEGGPKNMLVNTTGVKACDGLGKAIAAVHRRAIHPNPPWPMANGPLFAVSAPLARLVANDPYPMAWLDGIQRSEVAATMQARKGKIPNHLAGFSCFPMGDSVFGFWLSEISRRHHIRLTLVNSPLGVQHFAWGSWSFGNRSIVLHGLKGPNNPFWDFAMRRGSGPYIEYPRECDTCASMGWSTWPGSIVNEWTCCGRRVAGLPDKEGKRSPSGTGPRARRSTHPRRGEPRPKGLSMLSGRMKTAAKRAKKTPHEDSGSR